MKKFILIIIMIGILFILNDKKDELIIPKEAIRFRVIANSNSNFDQNTKMLVRDKIEKQITEDLSETSDINEARKTLNNNVSNYQEIVNKTLEDNKIKEEFNINYGLNYFPEKVYKGVKYENGYYESLVITLGNGLGDNWWCVLFPPLCLLEAEEDEETTEVEYKFFIKDLIDKFF